MGGCENDRQMIARVAEAEADPVAALQPQRQKMTCRSGDQSAELSPSTIAGASGRVTEK